MADKRHKRRKNDARGRLTNNVQVVNVENYAPGRVVIVGAWPQGGVREHGLAPQQSVIYGVDNLCFPQ